MHSLKLMVGITVCLCWLSLPMIYSQIPGIPTPEEQEMITTAFNSRRADTTPRASDMQKVYWSPELAPIALSHVQKCVNEPNPLRNSASGKFSVVGETIGLIADGNIKSLQSLIEFWFSQPYRYNKQQCDAGSDDVSDTCDDYLEVAWKRTCEVACAIASCPELDLNDFRSYLNFLDLDDHDVTDPHLVVCNYGPGNPDHFQLPYTSGTACGDCPRGFRMCYIPPESDNDDDGDDDDGDDDDGDDDDGDDDVGGDEEDDETMESTSLKRGLCHNEAEMCMGSDPHFAIRLSGGHLLCFTFQGAHNTTFNLVSNKHIQMNALFVPDHTNWDNTWLGAIGMTILHDGHKNSTLEFIASNQLIRLGSSIPIPANLIKKLLYHNGRLTIQYVPSNHTAKYPRVQVQLIDYDINFTVVFAKNNHLDLYWHSSGAPYKHSRGVVGQFFRHGVRIDVHAKLLHVPSRRNPVIVEEQALWKFMQQKFHSDTKCWTSAYHSSQGAGIVEGSYKDYIVDSLLAVGH